MGGNKASISDAKDWAPAVLGARHTTHHENKAALPCFGRELVPSGGKPAVLRARAAQTIVRNTCTTLLQRAASQHGTAEWWRATSWHD